MSRFPFAMGNLQRVRAGVQPRRPDFLPALLQLLQQGNQQNAQRADQRFQLLNQGLEDHRRASREAKQANESRYNEILNAINSGLSGVMSDLEGFGQSQVSDLNRSYDVQRNNLLADLAERGMSGSTARIPIEASVTEGRQRGLERINDMLRDRRSSARERFLDRSTGVMERRTDAYPDPFPLDLASLVGSLSDTGGGVGGLDLASLLPLLQMQQPPVRTPGARQASIKMAETPAVNPIYAPVPHTRTVSDVQNSAEAEMARRRALVDVKNARESGGAAPGGRIAREREAQNRAILGGFANYAPAQQAPTVPGAHPNILNYGDDTTPYLMQLLQQLTAQQGYQQPQQATEPQRQMVPHNTIYPSRPQMQVPVALPTAGLPIANMAVLADVLNNPVAQRRRNTEQKVRDLYAKARQRRKSNVAVGG